MRDECCAERQKFETRTNRSDRIERTLNSLIAFGLEKPLLVMRAGPINVLQEGASAERRETLSDSVSSSKIPTLETAGKLHYSRQFTTFRPTKLQVESRNHHVCFVKSSAERARCWAARPATTFARYLMSR
eukprot:4543846-Prymnesium_polylepis.1